MTPPLLAITKLAIKVLAFAVGLIGLTSCDAKIADPKTSLQLIDGRQLTLGAIPARVTIVNFWSTSCTVCIAEQADLSRLYETYHPRGLELIGVAMPYDRPDMVLNYVRTKHVPYPIALDLKGSVTQAFGGISGTPTSFVLLKSKAVYQKVLGAVKFEKLEAELLPLLELKKLNQG